MIHSSSITLKGIHTIGVNPYNKVALSKRQCIFRDASRRLLAWCDSVWNQGAILVYIHFRFSLHGEKNAVSGNGESCWDRGDQAGSENGAATGGKYAKGAGEGLFFGSETSVDL